MEQKLAIHCSKSLISHAGRLIGRACFATSDFEEKATSGRLGDSSVISKLAFCLPRIRAAVAEQNMSRIKLATTNHRWLPRERVKWCAAAASTATATATVGNGQTESYSMWSAIVATTGIDRKSTRLNSSHLVISYAV